MSPSQEAKVLTIRSTAMVFLMLTGLLAFCWLLFGDARIQAGTFISGLIAVMTWSSYCQQKTTAEVSWVVGRQKSN